MSIDEEYEREHDEYGNPLENDDPEGTRKKAVLNMMMPKIILSIVIPMILVGMLILIL